jgi:hypothetical protein
MIIQGLIRDDEDEEEDWEHVDYIHDLRTNPFSNGSDITEVKHDETLTGKGTAAAPLSVVLNQLLIPDVEQKILETADDTKIISGNVTIDNESIDIMGEDSDMLLSTTTLSFTRSNYEMFLENDNEFPCLFLHSSQTGDYVQVGFEGFIARGDMRLMTLNEAY